MTSLLTIIPDINPDSKPQREGVRQEICQLMLIADPLFLRNQYSQANYKIRGIKRPKRTRVSALVRAQDQYFYTRKVNDLAPPRRSNSEGVDNRSEFFAWRCRTNKCKH